MPPRAEVEPSDDTGDWQYANLDAERHQDELNEPMGASDSDYDEASAYEHEGDGEPY